MMSVSNSSLPSHICSRYTYGSPPIDLISLEFVAGVAKSMIYISARFYMMVCVYVKQA